MSLAPRFPETRVYALAVEFKPLCFEETLTIDLVFLSVRVRELAFAVSPPKLCDDLCAFEETSVFETRVGENADSVAVSDDLFVPLGRLRHDGKAYGKREGVDEQQLFSWDMPVSRDKDGYRKSFTETPSRSGASRRLMTIWDLILPLLEPPLCLEFPDFLDIPNPLYPYQVDGVRFLIDRESALLADDMGTGKTVTAIVALRALFHMGRISSALVVVPVGLLKNWDRELQKWAPTLSGVTVVRGPKPQREIQWEKPAHVWVTSYGLVREDIDHIVRHREFDLVVLDELQAIKNRDADQAQAVKRLPRKKAWGLSGTPIENSLDDLVSIFEFLRPGLLGRSTVTPDGAKQAIKNYFLRHRKHDVLPGLPPKRPFEQWVVLEGAQRDAYTRAEEDGIVWLEKLGDDRTVAHALELLQRLKMLCNRDPRSGESAKLELLDLRLAGAISSGSKALVFSQYLDEGVHIIERRYRDYNPVLITGNVTGARRDRAVNAFQSDERYKLLIATPKTGGIGLTLTAANYVFHFDHWWNPATPLQAEDRAHRIGQTKEVFVYHIWTEGTVEERIYRILKDKQTLYDHVIDDLSTVGNTGLSEDELFGLFGLKSPRKRATTGKSSTKGGRNTIERLLRLSPQEFEATVGRLYEKLGYGVRTTGASRDGGVDIVASGAFAGGGSQKLAIQCKRYDPERKVGSPEVRELLGVLARDRSFTKGVLVTTSDFSQDSRSFAFDQGNLELIDGVRLVQLVESRGLAL